MKCSICNEDFDGFGNNAEPVNDGRCCDNCNNLVTATRLKIHFKRLKKELK